MKPQSTLAISVLALASLFGCDRRRDEPQVTPTPANPAAREPAVEEERQKVAGRELQDEPSTNRSNAVPANRGAVEAITRTRCQREARCGNIGPDEKFATPEACMSSVGKEWADDLDFDDCAGGIVQKELDECLSEIRNEDCGNPLDSLGRVAACRESDLCKSVP